jgi:hypothetical protein
MCAQNGVTAAQRAAGGVAFPWPQAERPMMFWAQPGAEELSTSGTSFLNRAGAHTPSSALPAACQERLASRVWRPAPASEGVGAWEEHAGCSWESLLPSG